MPILSDNEQEHDCIFHFCDAMSPLAPHCDVIMTLTPLPVLHNIADTLRKVLCKFEINPTDSSQDIAIFVFPCFPTIWDMATELTPKQLITQSAQATAHAIASTLTAQTTSISLPTYDLDLKDAYHFFSIFWHTLENWFLFNHIVTNSESHLWYVFVALGTKSLEIHAQWIPTADEEEWRVTKAKVSTFLDKTKQGMTHAVNTYVWLGELEDVVARPREGPQDLFVCIKTMLDQCKMINVEDWEHELCQCIVHAYHQEGKLLDKLMAQSFKTPSSELTDITVSHYAIQHAQEQVSHSSKPVAAICHEKHWGAHTSHDGDVTHHLHPPRTALLHKTVSNQQNKLPHKGFQMLQMQEERKKMDQILKECQGCIGITDDITVYGHTKAEHDSNLQNFMHVTHKYGFVFNPQKTHVKTPAVNFFYLYDADGVHLDPDKVSAVHPLSTPTNVTKLQEFLGMVMYLSPFILGLSTLTAPLHELLNKDTDFT